MLSDCTLIIRDSPISIRVASRYRTGSNSGNPLSFERTWGLVVFELLNVCCRDGLGELYTATFNGECSKVDFVTKIFNQEHQTIERQQEFYVRYFLPWAAKASFKTDPCNWYVGAEWWKVAEERLDEYSFKEYYPWQSYSSDFDLIRRMPGALPRKLNNRRR